MRWLLLAFALISRVLSAAQSDTSRTLNAAPSPDTLLPGYEFSYPVNKNRASIYLYNGDIVKGRIIAVYDHFLTIQRIRDTKIVPPPPPGFLTIDSIAVIYFRRNSFFNGMAAGALLGFLGGYTVGRSITTYNSESERLWKSIKMGGAVMVPAAVLGALIGPIITRKRFEIWGSHHNLIGVMMKISLIE